MIWLQNSPPQTQALIDQAFAAKFHPETIKAPAPVTSISELFEASASRLHNEQAIAEMNKRLFQLQARAVGSNHKALFKWGGMGIPCDVTPVGVNEIEVKTLTAHKSLPAGHTWKTNWTSLRLQGNVLYIG